MPSTVVSFVLAGTVPLLPYMMPVQEGRRLSWSVLLTMASLFGVGVARAAVTRDRWWRTGSEMLLLGGVVAVAAYGAGALVAAVAGGI